MRLIDWFSGLSVELLIFALIIPAYLIGPLEDLRSAAKRRARL